jgi:hypothetical protein
MTDEPTSIQTGGGAAVPGQVATGGGGFAGRDQITLVINNWGWEGAARQLQTGAEPPRAAAWRGWNWREAAERYCRNLLKDYSTIRVLGKADPVPLEGIFTDVYILDKLTARLRYDMDELRQRGADRDDLRRQPQDRIPGIDLVRTGRNLFLLGKPGAGKTTFLKYIALGRQTQHLLRRQRTACPVPQPGRGERPAGDFGQPVAAAGAHAKGRCVITS